MRHILIRGGTQQQRWNWIESNTGYNKVYYTFEEFLLATHTLECDYVYILKEPEIWRVSPYLYMLRFRNKTFEPIVVTLTSPQNRIPILSDKAPDLLHQCNAKEIVVAKWEKEEPVRRLRNETLISHESHEDNKSV